MSSLATDRDVTIIGAGPAGLSLARELGDRGVRPLVVEAGPVVAWSWARMPENLKLLSPWKVNCLRGTSWSWREMHKKHLCRDFQQYCGGYAAENALDVRTDWPVERVRAVEAGFEVVGASDTLVSRTLINATGYFSKPNIPAFAGLDTTAIPTRHVSQYQSPEDTERLLGDRDKRILVVGGRISAGQTFEELHRAGFRVALSCRHEIEFAQEPWLLELAFFFYYQWENFRVRRNPYYRNESYPPMEAGEAKRLLETGAVARYPDIRAFEDDAIVFVDGRREAFDLVIFATGFRPSLGHLEGLVTVAPPLYQPELDGMESTEAPGLFFLGLDMMRSFRSRYLRGIREDAAALAESLVARLRSEAA